MAGLQIAKVFFDFIEHDVAPGLGLDVATFWQSFAKIIKDLSPENQRLLAKRDQLQSQIDDWHLNQRNKAHDAQTYENYLREIGYLEEPPPAFTITTDTVDPEIACIAGPQLVVPVNNARYALNAANARWSSLYDALYGSDIVNDENGSGKLNAYNPLRGEKVIALAMDFLDAAVPLAAGSHKAVKRYKVVEKDSVHLLKIILNSGEETTLKSLEQFVAYDGLQACRLILLKNNGLHIQLMIDPDSDAGEQHPAGIKDLVLESALSVIQDCEDSVTAVDAEDKVDVYKNWLGLMRGDLAITFNHNGKTVSRCLNPDLQFVGVDGNPLTLTGRSLLLVRNVGLLMNTDVVLNDQGEEIPEGILDGMITSLIALYDLKGKGQYKNSRADSIYIVKPKMHGSEEVAFANELFNRIEQALQLKKNTIKIGVMDEERRTTVNLKACIYACRGRLIFINTGFLDRTGDEIHTSMEAGPMLPKEQLKQQPWLSGYENSNVDTGLACGMGGKAQIGKGMWAIPDQMNNMLKSKIAHPLAGANTAWVPSPTAACIHVMHYHQVDVRSRQKLLKTRVPITLEQLLTIPLLQDLKTLSEKEILNELENNAQGILGYVVRWVDQGVGCSKVPDINDVGLMEDRATLRISSQHIANWLHHGVCSSQQVLSIFKKMAGVVDQQNKNDPNYEPMAVSFDGFAFRAALDLVLKGRVQPNGYTEPLLLSYRRKKKSEA